MALGHIKLDDLANQAKFWYGVLFVLMLLLVHLAPNLEVWLGDHQARLRPPRPVFSYFDGMTTNRVRRSWLTNRRIESLTSLMYRFNMLVVIERKLKATLRTPNGNGTINYQFIPKDSG